MFFNCKIEFNLIHVNLGKCDYFIQYQYPNFAYRKEEGKYTKSITSNAVVMTKTFF